MLKSSRDMRDVAQTFLVNKYKDLMEQISRAVEDASNKGLFSVSIYLKGLSPEDKDYLRSELRKRNYEEQVSYDSRDSLHLFKVKW